MASAGDRLASAKAVLAEGFPATAVGTAYYAMLHAARAALSEEDFRERFVLPGHVAADHFGRAQDAQRLREAADYEGGEPSEAEAAAIVDAAESFVESVREVLRA